MPPYFADNAASFTVYTFNSAGAATDPTTLTVYIRQPRDEEDLTSYVWAGVNTANITKTATGIFTVTFTPAMTGVWQVGVTAQGAVIANAASELAVEPLYPLS